MILSWLSAARYLNNLRWCGSLFPEIVFDEKKFLLEIKKTVNKEGYCVIVASEGVRNKKGKFLAESNLKDAFGHSQLGGVAPFLSNLINAKLKLKNQQNIHY